MEIESKETSAPSTYIIFEAGLNHNGSPKLAEDLVRAAAAAGADAVKFQKRNISTLANREMLASEELRFPSLGKTYQAVREKLELNFETYCSLRDLSHQLGLDFMVTPFDEDSLDFVMSVGVDSLKIASHSVAHPRLLAKVSQVSLPIYMSSGMVTLQELDTAVEIFEHHRRFTLLHCSSEYPTLSSGANLRLIPYLRERYRRPVGFSSHELGITHSIAAVALGAVALERHVTLDKNLEGFDHKMSLNAAEFGQLVRHVREIETAMGHERKEISPEEQKTRNKYRVSMVASRDLEKGETLTKEMISYKNPGTGMPASDETKYVGRTLKRAVSFDSLLMPEDFATI